MTCPSLRALFAGVLLGAPVAAQWPSTDPISVDITQNEVLHELLRFEVQGSSTTSTFDGLVVPYLSVANVPQYWEKFAQSVLPSVRYHSESSVGTGWAGSLTGVNATAPQDANRPFRMPASVAQRAIDEIIWNSLGSFTRPIAGTSPAMDWPNTNWPAAGGSSMLWSNYSSTLGTQYFDRENLIRQIIVNQHHATTGATIETNSAQVNTLVTMIKEDIAEFELTVILIEIQDPPQTNSPANLKLSLSSTVTLKLAPESNIDQFFFTYDPNDYSVQLLPGESWSPYLFPIVLGEPYSIGVPGAFLPGQVVKMAIPLVTGGWTLLPTTTSLTPNLNTAVTANIPNSSNLASGMVALVDAITGLPIPIMAPGPNGPTETSLYGTGVLFQPWTPPPH